MVDPLCFNIRFSPISSPRYWEVPLIPSSKFHRDEREREIPYNHKKRRTVFFSFFGFCRIARDPRRHVSRDRYVGYSIYVRRPAATDLGGWLQRGEIDLQFKSIPVRACGSFGSMLMLEMLCAHTALLPKSLDHTKIILSIADKLKKNNNDNNSQSIFSKPQ